MSIIECEGKYINNGTTTNDTRSMMNIDTDELLLISRQMHDSFVSSFKGVPVRVDPELDENYWYVAVSEKLFNEIKEQCGVNTV